MSCCVATVERCDPNTGATVWLLITDTDVSAKNVDGTNYPGDRALLVDCTPGATSSFAGPVTNNDGTETYTHADGDGTTFPIVVPEVCKVVAPNGQTGTQIGAFIHACTVLDLGGQDPEAAGFPAAGYPEWWVQPFTGGVTGSESWLVQADANGVMQFHQLA